MPIYSHSQLSTYEQCPLKYKFSYRDKIKRDTRGVEAFMGSMVHDILQRCYEDLRRGRLHTCGDLLHMFDDLWDKNWNDSIIIIRQGFSPEDYRSSGKKMIESYYTRHAPFDSDITLATELRVPIALGDDGKYKLQGYIDRLSRTPEGIYQIRDYKTSAHLPTQDEADSDRQLALYQIGVRNMWPDIEHVSLIWHYLAFDTELVSSRSNEAINRLIEETVVLIDEIESSGEFTPRESRLCDWCEYPDLCPMRKHFYMVESLPMNEYLSEPGVVLVNKYVELREQARSIDTEIEQVKEALVEYARLQDVELIKGSDMKARVKFQEKLKFPGKNDEGREELDGVITEAGKWLEVSQLDITALTHIVESGVWDEDLLDRVMEYGRIEEASAIYLSKLKEEEK